MDARKELEKRLRSERLVAIVCDDLKASFQLRYFFSRGHEIGTLDVSVPRKRPSTASIADIFPPADVYEREIHDFFGVTFAGNKNMGKTLFLPEDYDGKPPLLK